MCIRPPCPNCGADYDACLSECPKCGHPDGGLPPLPMPVFTPVTKEIWCKICQKNHVATEYVLEVV